MTIQTETNFNIAGEIPVASFVTKGAQNDVFIVPFPGVRNVVAQHYTGTAEACTFTTVTIANGGAAYDETTTSIVYGSATANYRTSGGYYLITTGGEIIYVIADSGAASTGGTLTVKRGCLGTTATGTGLANTNVCYVMNALTLSTATTTGKVFVSYSPLPADPNTKLFV